METKRARSIKKQLGQFMTPPELSKSLVEPLPILKDQIILEPCFGTGSFVFALIDKMLPIYDNDIKEVINHIYGCEIDESLYAQFCQELSSRYAIKDFSHFICIDFFDYKPSLHFDWIIGNPPFGGTVSSSIIKEDQLDKAYGKRLNKKIKKETYSFFTVKCIDDLLAPSGHLSFICSSTFLTLSTHQGLREYFYKTGSLQLSDISVFSEETKYPMVWFTYNKSRIQEFITYNNKNILIKDIERTPNSSFIVTPEIAILYDQPLISDFFIGSSGMTIGNNALFLRDVAPDGSILEPYEFNFILRPLTEEDLIYQSRSGSISATARSKLGELNYFLDYKLLDTPKLISPGSPEYSDYKPYSRMNIEDTFKVDFHTAIYWKDNGRAVLTYKKTGKWYLHGVGGKKYFNKTGITWNLISSTFYPLLMPYGFIFDSGRPSIFHKNDQNVVEDFLYAFAWLSSNKCNRVLKNTINNTRNIQSKDITKLPLPMISQKQQAINLTAQLMANEIDINIYRIQVNKLFS